MARKKGDKSKKAIEMKGFVKYCSSFGLNKSQILRHGPITEQEIKETIK